MNPAERVRSISRPLRTLLVVALALPILSFIVMRVLVLAASYEVIDVAGTGLNAVDGLLNVTIIIVYMVWLARVYRAIAARGGKTSMGAGLAIGGWFIPIGNLFLPWLGLRAAWRGARTDGSALVGVWWITYLLGTFITVGQTLLSSGGTIDPELAWVYSAVGWLNMLLTFATYGTWLAVVSKITGAFGADASAPAQAGIPNPLAT